MSSGDLFPGVQQPNREPDHSSLMLNLRITGTMHSLLHIPSWRIQKQIYLEAAEMRFIRSITRYTILDKIRSEVTRKELENYGIKNVSAKYKQNWINHLKKLDNTRLPKHALNYKPRGIRDRGRSRKRWQRVDAGTGQET
jgi:hypothetical protein